jgi:hypothetical protein
MLHSSAQKLGTEDEWVVRIMDVNEVTAFWPEIEEALDAQPELWNQYYTKPTLFDAIVHNHVHVIGAAKSGVVVMIGMCAVTTWPAGKRLRVFFMYGEGLEEAGVLLDHACEHFARITGCRHIDVVGRRGFERFGKQFGYEFVCVHISRPVDQRSH